MSDLLNSVKVQNMIKVIQSLDQGDVDELFSYIPKIQGELTSEQQDVYNTLLREAEKAFAGLEIPNQLYFGWVLGFVIGKDKEVLELEVV